MFTRPRPTLQTEYKDKLPLLLENQTQTYMHHKIYALTDIRWWPATLEVQDVPIFTKLQSTCK
jgi:hypothetical protein